MTKIIVRLKGYKNSFNNKEYKTKKEAKEFVTHWNMWHKDAQLEVVEMLYL